MIIFKHVEFEFKGANHLEELLEHVQETTSQIKGAKLNGIYNSYIISSRVTRRKADDQSLAFFR